MPKNLNSAPVLESVWMPSALAALGLAAAPAAVGVSALWLGSGAWLGRLVRNLGRPTDRPQ